MPFEPKLFSEKESGQESSAPPECCPAELLREPAAPVWRDAAELELPDDLAMLADQLRDDAVYLARRHPADATPEQREAAWRSHVEGESKPLEKSIMPYSWRWISAAAALVVALACGWSAWYFQSGGNDGGDPIATAGIESSPAQAPGMGNSQAGRTTPVALERAPAEARPVGEKPAARDELPQDQPRLIPATFIRDLSGPELEAVMDLLEQEESGLSI